MKGDAIIKSCSAFQGNLGVFSPLSLPCELPCDIGNVASAMKESQRVLAKTPGIIVLGFIQLPFLPEVFAV